MRVYSPSSTTSFMTCPSLWWLKSVQGYQSKRLGNPEMAAAVGIGVSAGMEAYYKGEDVEKSIVAGQESAMTFLQGRLESGGIVLPRSETTFEAVPKRVEKCIRGFHKAQPFPSDWHDFIPELTFPDHGRARADLLCQSDLGPCIVDFKTKVTAQDYIVDNFLSDAETSWQMHHYIWSARQMGLDVSSFAICLMVIEPFKVYLEQWVVEEERLAAWQESALYWWAQMEEVEKRGALNPLLVPRAGDHRSKYGLCEMYAGCMNDNWAMEYTKKERAA